jgi:hypothetical protein
MSERDGSHRSLSRHRGLYALLIVVVICMGLATSSVEKCFEIWNDYSQEGILIAVWLWTTPTV